MCFRFAALVLCSLASLSGSSVLFGQPVRLHPENPHYLEYKGKPFLVVSSAEHYGAVLNADFDDARYLETLEREGMNYTRIFTGTYIELPGSFGIQRNTLAPATGRLIAPWARSAEPGFAAGGNKFDLSRWNEAYFTRLKDFVASAQRRGILVEVTLFTSTYGEDRWNTSPLHPRNNQNGTTALADWKSLHTPANGNLLGHQERLVRKILRELNSFDNVIFEIQNEPWADQGRVAHWRNPYLGSPARDRFPNTIDIPTEASLDWHDLVAGWIHEEERSLPKRHLIAFNYCNFLFPVHRVPRYVSIVHFHYAYPEAVRLNDSLGKLIGYDESGFRGRDDDVYRREAWRFLLAGGGLFNGLDYSFSVGKEDGTDTEPNGPGGGSPALRRQLRILREFLEGFDFPRMAPDSESVRHAPGSFVQALSQPGAAYAVYVEATAVAGSLQMLLPDGSYQAEWVDPLNGAVLGSARLRGGAEPVAVSLPAVNRDLALRIRRTP
jgi:hypothetical protein